MVKKCGMWVNLYSYIHQNKKLFDDEQISFLNVSIPCNCMVSDQHVVIYCWQSAELGDNHIIGWPGKLTLSWEWILESWIFVSLLAS